MKKDQKEELRRHVKSLPCFTCLFRLTCAHFLINGNVRIKEICDMFNKWREEEDKIMTFGIGRGKIVIEEILEILRKEKDGYAKSSENR